MLYEESPYSNWILTETMKSYLRAESQDNDLWDKGNKYLDVVQLSRKMGPWKDIFNYDYQY